LSGYVTSSVANSQVTEELLLQFEA